MSSEKAKKAYRVKFTAIRQLTPEDAAKFGPYYKQFVTDYANRPSSDAVEEEQPQETYVSEEDAGEVIDAEVTEV